MIKIKVHHLTAIEKTALWLLIFEKVQFESRTAGTAGEDRFLSMLSVCEFWSCFSCKREVSRKEIAPQSGKFASSLKRKA